MNKIAIMTPVGLVLCATAHAQQNLPQPFAFRFGYSYLTNGSARDTTTGGGVTAGFGYDFLTYGNGGRLSVDLDLDIHRGNGNKLESASLMVVARHPFTTNTEGNVQFYYGAGAGISRAFSNFSTTTGGGSSVTITENSSTDYNACAELLLGARLNQQSAMELFLRLGARSQGLQGTTLGLIYAVHF